MNHTIHKLAVSNNRSNRSKSILMILSIFLSTLLLSVVASFGCGLVRHNRKNAGNIYGNYCGTFRQVTEEQYQKIKLRSEFTNLGKTVSVAEVNAQETEELRQKTGNTIGKVTMGLICMDIGAADNTNFINSLKAGQLPQKEHEIAASREFFAYLGAENPQLGDSVSVAYRTDKHSEFKEQDFIISGILKSQETGYVQKTFQGYVSLAFYESIMPEDMRYYDVTFRLSPSVELVGDKEEALKELGARCGIDKKYVSENFGYMVWTYDPGTETIVFCVGIALIVVLVSVAVIYNIFQVGVVQKIQEYGKIKALGATKKQMKKLIWREGMLLSVIGIPLGILAGCTLAEVLLNKIIVDGTKSTMHTNLTKVSVVSLPLLILVALAAFCTVYLALKRPMRTVAKVSPVEAIRYQESTGSRKTMRKGSKGISVTGMTLANLSANRRRTVSTICTMGLSCVLFVALSNIAGNLDNEFEARRSMENGQFSVELDYSIGDTAYPENNLGNIQKNNPLGNEFQEQLRAIPGVTEVKTRKLFEAESLDAGSKDNENMVRNHTVISVMNREEFLRYGKGSALGNLDYDEVSAADGIIYGYSHFFADDGYQLGQQIHFIVEDASQAEYKGEIMGSFGSAPGMWVITEDTFQKLGITGNMTQKVWVDCDEKDKQQVEAAIQELLVGVSHVETDSYDDAMQVVEMNSSLMQSGIYMFLFLLGVIGFLNMANTIITSAVTRKRELGVLQAVGMTNRQLNQMLQLEGILFSVGTIIISLAVGSPLGYALFCYAKENHIYAINEYHFPILEIGVMLLVIFVLQMGLSFLLSRNLHRDSLVERISYQG